VVWSKEHRKLWAAPGCCSATDEHQQPVPCRGGLVTVTLSTAPAPLLPTCPFLPTISNWQLQLLQRVMPPPATGKGSSSWKCHDSDWAASCCYCCCRCWHHRAHLLLN
jgi:hypothetical protein